MEKTFQEILEKLKGINLALVGTVNMNFQGIEIEPNDIDFVTDDYGIEKIAKIFFSNITDNDGYKETEFALRGSKVHFISKTTNPLRMDDSINPIFIRKWDLEIPVMPLEYELEFYKKLNTSKAEVKVSLIKEKLNK